MPNETVQINTKIRQLITAHFPLARRTSVLDDDSPLLNSGIIDSLGVLDLLMLIEEEFKITISDEDLLPENFETIANLTAFVQFKGNGALIL